MASLPAAQILESPPKTGLMSESEKKEKNLYLKFQNFMSKQRQQNLYERLKNFYGKNYAINYKQQFNFNEQWQGKGLMQRHCDHNLMEQNGAGYLLYSVVFMLMNVAVVWTMSFERYFDTKSISTGTGLGIYQSLLAFTMIDMGLDIYYRMKLVQGYRFQLWKEIRGHLGHLCIIAYLAWLLVQETKGVAFYVLEFMIMTLVYRKASKIYQSIKVTEFSLKYENQMKILDLLLNVFIQAHLFAVIFFSASKMNPSQNWVLSAGLAGAGPLTKYIYAFYFASTTMLTIGYGDITPKSREEIVVTVVIELIAVVSFGYLLNEMGHTLSKMREQGEELDRDLQTISKMSKYYNLQRSLQNKAKSFLFNNQVREELKVEDQRRVLLKLNEELRQQIHHQNSLNVIKSCIFFICNWSKAFQSEIARKLQKRLFAPNERLVPVGGPARVFIIKHGRLDIFMNRFGSSQQRGGYSKERRKLLKVLSSEGRKQVSDNVYGYTAVFSNRPVRLQAVAGEFTSTYSVTGEQFIKAVRQHAQDFEYFHEVKCRIDQSLFSEQWQAPSISNIRQHYCPSKIITIKKFRRNLQRSSNHRKRIIRRDRCKSFKLLEDLAVVSREQTGAGVQKTIVFTSRRLLAKSSRSLEEFSSDREPEMMQTSSLEDVLDDSVRVSYQHAKAALLTRTRMRGSDERENKKLIAHIFEVHKDFTNFFRKNNISNVLQGFCKENFLEKGLGNDRSTSPKNRSAHSHPPK